VQEGSGATATGQDKTLGRNEAGVAGFDELLQPAHLLVAQARELILAPPTCGCGEVGTEIKQVVLDASELPVDLLGHAFGAHDPEQAVEFVDCSIGVNARAGLGYPGTIGKAGRSLVAAAGGYAVKFDHFAFPLSVGFRAETGRQPVA
jgi:hypothetical protein